MSSVLLGNQNVLLWEYETYPWYPKRIYSQKNTLKSDVLGFIRKSEK